MQRKHWSLVLQEVHEEQLCVESVTHIMPSFTVLCRSVLDASFGERKLVPECFLWIILFLQSFHNAFS